MTKQAVVKARVPGASAVDLLLDDNIGLTSPTTHAMTEGADDVWAVTLTGLAADTQYYYGFDGSAVTGTFKTPDDDGAEFSFTIASASCAGHSGGEYVTNKVSNAPTFDHIVARDPFMFLHLGDRHYRDISTNNVASFRTAYADVMAADKQLALHQAMAVDYQWNDHDFGANDSNGSSASKPAAQQVYREHVPHWTLPSASAIYHSFVIGRVRFIVLDDRSERSSNGATDSSSKTMLGATQKAWLINEVTTATEPLIVIACGSPWIGSASISWGSFSTERDELITEFGADAAKCLMLYGDIHYTAADDGNNSPGGIPAVCAGPMDAGWSSNDGTYSEGIHKDSHQQYVTLVFDDNSTTIDVTVKGWAVFDTVETELFSMDLSYPA